MNIMRDEQNMAELERYRAKHHHEFNSEKHV